MVFELFFDGEMFRNAIPRLYSEGGIFWGLCYFASSFPEDRSLWV
jgi:hypothetical protein